MGFLVTLLILHKAFFHDEAHMAKLFFFLTKRQINAVNHESSILSRIYEYQMIIIYIDQEFVVRTYKFYYVIHVFVRIGKYICLKSEKCPTIYLFLFKTVNIVNVFI